MHYTAINLNPKMKYDTKELLKFFAQNQLRRSKDVSKTKRDLMLFYMVNIEGATLKEIADIFGNSAGYLWARNRSMCRKFKEFLHKHKLSI